MGARPWHRRRRNGEAWAEDVADARERARRHRSGASPAQGRGDPARRGALGWEAAPAGATRPPTATTAAVARSAAAAAPSSPASASTWPVRSQAGARIVPQVRVTQVLIERGHAVGVEGKALVPGTEAGSAHAPLDRPCPPGGPRCRRAPHAGDPAGVRPASPGDRTAPATASGAGRGRSDDEPVDMWRGHDAGGSIARVRSRRRRAGTATSSSRRPGIPACWRSPCHGTGPTRTPRRCVTPAISPRSSRSPATAARAG